MTETFTSRSPIPEAVTHPRSLRAVVAAGMLSLLAGCGADKTEFITVNPGWGVEVEAIHPGKEPKPATSKLVEPTFELGKPKPTESVWEVTPGEPGTEDQVQVEVCRPGDDPKDVRYPKVGKDEQESGCESGVLSIKEYVLYFKKKPKVGDTPILGEKQSPFTVAVCKDLADGCR